jgi:two-component system chemotaxis response regulator CheB
MARNAAAPLTVVALGGSAGSLDALAAFLPDLDPDWPLAFALVVHLPRTGPSALASVLAAQTRLAVREVVDKEPLQAGTLHVAIPGYHLLVERGPAAALSVDEPVHHSIPSIDVLLESAAAACGPRVVGIVLSGANEDGADGLAAVCAAGGAAAVQAPDEAAVRTMPAAALARCPGAAVLRAREIAGFLRARVEIAAREAAP